MNLPAGDREFMLNVLRPYFRVQGALAIDWSDSTKKWPDIWCEPGAVPRIVITREWRRHDADERRKRLIHEFIHLFWGLDHGVHDGRMYSTKPVEDEYSRMVYLHILRSAKNPDDPSRVPVQVRVIRKEQEREMPLKSLDELPVDWWKKLQAPRRPYPNPFRDHFYVTRYENFLCFWHRKGSMAGLSDATGRLDTKTGIAEIRFIYVDRPRSGIGRQTVAEIEDYLVRRGAKEVRGDAIRGSEPFWAAVGYDVRPLARPIADVTARIRKILK